MAQTAKQQTKQPKPAPTGLATSVAQLVAAPAATPTAPRGVAAQAIVQAAIAAGTAAPGATALAHVYGKGGASVGNTARLPAGSLQVTAKGAAYAPKPGYNANAWAAVQAAVKAGPCSASQAATAIGHKGAAWLAYAVKSGWLAVTK